MFSLTRQERQVILFLITVTTVGIAIDFLAKKCPPIRAVATLNQDIGKVDLNKSDKAILIEVCGIGEKIAQRIIEYRKQNGNFTSTEDLKKIKGINDYRYEKLKDILFVK
jgi:competence ComEA-like helix-hairpin-helix protein